MGTRDTGRCARFREGGGGGAGPCGVKSCARIAGQALKLILADWSPAISHRTNARGAETLREVSRSVSLRLAGAGKAREGTHPRAQGTEAPRHEGEAWALRHRAKCLILSHGVSPGAIGGKGRGDTGTRGAAKVSHCVSACLAGGNAPNRGDIHLSKKSAGPQRQTGRDHGEMLNAEC